MSTLATYGSANASVMVPSRADCSRQRKTRRGHVMSYRSRGKTLDDPLVWRRGVTAEAEAVVEAGGSPLPELDRGRHYPESISVS